MPSLDSISFVASAFALYGDTDGVRVWHTPAGDRVGLYYYPKSPDIAANTNSIDEVRRFYRKVATDAGRGVIEIDILEIDGCLAIRTIFKASQQPSGMTYIGSITLPFRDFSYVLKVQCVEHGMTGIREAVVLDETLTSRQPPGCAARVGRALGFLRVLRKLFSNARGLFLAALSRSRQTRRAGLEEIDWAKDLYDDSSKSPLMRNIAEDEKYDADFPDHPLSRVRIVLEQIQRSLRISNDVKSEPGFYYVP